jgi:hypothetical protein
MVRNPKVIASIHPEQLRRRLRLFHSFTRGSAWHEYGFSGSGCHHTLKPAKNPNAQSCSHPLRGISNIEPISIFIIML